MVQPKEGGTHDNSPVSDRTNRLSVRSHGVNFWRHRLNLLRVHSSAKHGPEFGTPIHQLPLTGAVPVREPH